MIDLDLTQLAELAEKDPDAAAQQLQKYVDSLTPAEKGEVYINLANVYLQMQADHQERMVEILDQQLLALRQLDKQEKQELEQADLADLREQLKE